MVEGIDHPLVSEVKSFIEYDDRLNYQRVDPWIRNACHKIKSGKFDKKKFVPALEKYLVNEAIDGYYHNKGGHKDVNKATKKAIAKAASGHILKVAKRVSKSRTLKCSKYESEPAKRWKRNF